MKRFAKIFVFVAAAMMTAGVGIGVDVANAAGQISAPNKWQLLSQNPCVSCDFGGCNCV